MPYDTKAVVSLKSVVTSGKISKELYLTPINSYQVVNGKVKLTIFVDTALADSSTPNPTAIVVAFSDATAFEFDLALEDMLTQAALAGMRIGLTVDPVPTPPKITGVTIPAAL